MKNNKEEILLQELRDMEYPYKIDVTEAVMAQLPDLPLQRMSDTESERKTFVMPRWAWLSAAAVLVAAVVSVVFYFQRPVDSQGIGEMMACVYDYDEYTSTSDDFYGEVFQDCDVQSDEE